MIKVKNMSARPQASRFVLTRPQRHLGQIADALGLVPLKQSRDLTDHGQGCHGQVRSPGVRSQLTEHAQVTRALLTAVVLLVLVSGCHVEDNFRDIVARESTTGKKRPSTD